MKTYGTIVLGAGFGDEGKGVTVHALTRPSTLVIRFNGGGQAGHTVVHNNKRHVFSNYGSGALKGTATLWSKYCAFDPGATYKEGERLGFPTLYVHNLCPVVTPYDIFANQNDKNYINNGTVGCGIGTTFKRHESFYTLYAGDLLFPDIVKTKLELIRTKYYSMSHINLTSHINLFMEYVKKISHHIILVNDREMNSLLSIHTNLVFEGAQGILLDQHFGFFPHVTRSCTTSKNVLTDPIFKDYVDEIVYVTRPYHTRHGNGPFTNLEHVDLLKLKNDENETNVSHQFQGEFKRTILNLDLLYYAIVCDDNYSKPGMQKSISITCLDQVDKTLIPITYENKLMYVNTRELVQLLPNIFKMIIEISSPDASKIEFIQL